jgi:hypothetical protein
MENRKDQQKDEFADKGRGFSKFVPHWLAQYDEEDDFLSGEVSHSLPQVTEEK